MKERSQGLVWLALALVIAIPELALRAGSATWWVAKGGDPGAGPWLAAALVDGVGLAALVVALASVIGSRRGWPTSMLLLLTALAMHPIGRILVFSFHDTGLGLAWCCVEIAVLVGVMVLERRRRLTVLMVALAAASALAFAVSLLVLTPLAV